MALLKLDMFIEEWIHGSDRELYSKLGTRDVESVNRVVVKEMAAWQGRTQLPYHTSGDH